MTRELRATQVCVDFSETSGGTTASVRQFRDALGGDILAFQRPGTAAIADEGAVVVDCSAHIGGRAYGWAGSKAKAIGEHLLADSDLVVCHMLYQYHVQWAASRARRLGIPYWVVPHGSLDPYVFSYRSARKRMWLSFIGRRAIHGAARVIFATHNELIKAEAMLGPIPNAFVQPWPTAKIDLPDWLERRRATRARLGIAETERVLIYLGRLHSMKRPLDTIRAIGPLAGIGISLLVVGPDGDVTASECIELCRKHNSLNIHTVGQVVGMEKYNYLAAADGFISLSFRENFGHAVAESLASQLPVILSSDIDLTSELREIECGWILPRRSDVMLSSALAQFAHATVSDLHAMGTNGRDWARTHLSTNVFNETMKALAQNDAQLPIGRY